VKVLYFHGIPSKVDAALAGPINAFSSHLRNICASITRLELFEERAHTPDTTTCIGA
jgi:hypothetical protein